MARRRGNGEGSIFQRGDGLWAATITIGYDEIGKRRRRTVYGRTKREVQEKLLKLQTDSMNGSLSEPQRLTLAKFLDQWLNGAVKTTVRKSTYIDYAGVVRNHINPHLGGVQLAKLNPIQVQAMFISMEKAGSSGRMRQKAYAVLHRALAQAMRWGLVQRNVCQAVDKPKPEKKTFRALSPDEANRFLEVAVEDRLYALYVLAIATGLRQGELFALQWENVDLKGGRLSVVHTLLELKGGIELGEPKSAKGRRLITLPSFAVTALRDHRKRMLAEGHPSPWVFCDTEGGPLRKSNLMRRSFRPLLDRAKLPRIRFHDLRHTAASLLLAQGVHPKIVQERLGHSQIALTLDTYSHVLPSLQEEAASKLDTLFRDRQG